MGNTETEPSREELISIIDELRADRAVGASLMNAARARADQDAAALRDMTADRDSWRTAAKNLQGELWRQIDMMRAEQERHAGEISHLSAAIGALIEIAQSRTGRATASQRETLAELPPMPPVAKETGPTLVEDQPPSAPPAPRAPTSASTHPDPFRMRAFVPANDADVVQHLIEKTPMDYPDPPPVLDGDRVGVFTELAAVNDRHAPVPKLAAPAADAEAPESTTQVDVLPTPEPDDGTPKKRQLRRPRRP